MGKTGEKYEPSNGTEGCFFTEKFCERCIHEKYMHTTNDNDKKCEIFSKTLLYSSDADEYPSEWTYDDKGQPTCTKFKFWDWGMGEVLNEPPEEEPFNPNQLKLEL